MGFRYVIDIITKVTNHENQIQKRVPRQRVFRNESLSRMCASLFDGTAKNWIDNMNKRWNMCLINESSETRVCQEYVLLKLPAPANKINNRFNYDIQIHGLLQENKWLTSVV